MNSEACHLWKCQITIIRVNSLFLHEYIFQAAQDWDLRKKEKTIYYRSGEYFYKR